MHLLITGRLQHIVFASSAFFFFFLKMRHLCWPNSYYNGIFFFCLSPPSALLSSLEFSIAPRLVKLPSVGLSTICSNYVTAAEKELTDRLPPSSTFEVFCNCHPLPEEAQLGTENNKGFTLFSPEMIVLCAVQLNAKQIQSNFCPDVAC